MCFIGLNMFELFLLVSAPFGRFLGASMLLDAFAFSGFCWC